jgi:hypothetical protein
VVSLSNHAIAPLDRLSLASKVSLGGFVIPAEAGLHIWPELARRLDTVLQLKDRCDEGFWGKADRLGAGGSGGQFSSSCKGP